MKNIIKKIIENHLPEKDWTKNWDFHQKGCSFRKRGKWVIFPCDMNCKNVLDNFTQINTSLMADEVLKVVVEKIIELDVYASDDYIMTGDMKCEKVEVFYKKDEVLQLLSNLSTNKENKNND